MFNDVNFYEQRDQSKHEKYLAALSDAQSLVQEENGEQQGESADSGDDSEKAAIESLKTILTQ